MDESSKLLENIIVPQQQLPTGYHKLSLDLPLVDKLIDLVLSSVDTTLPLECEVKVVESMSSPPDPTLSSESVNTEVVSLTQSSSCPSLPVESDLKPTDVFVAIYDCSTQEKILSLSIESYPSNESISFD